MDKELIEQVRKEAENLRKYATSTERRRIRVRKLDANNQYACIYGQMTGDCHSPRALQLLERCAEPVASGIPFEWDNYITTGDALVKNRSESVQKRAKERRFNDDGGGRAFFSAIEFFLAVSTKKQQAALVNFLYKRTGTLEL